VRERPKGVDCNLNEPAATPERKKKKKRPTKSLSRNEGRQGGLEEKKSRRDRKKERTCRSPDLSYGSSLQKKLNGHFEITVYVYNKGGEGIGGERRRGKKSAEALEMH